MDYKFQVSNGKIIKTYNPLTVLNLTRSFLIDKNAFIEVYRKVQGRETKNKNICKMYRLLILVNDKIKIQELMLSPGECGNCNWDNWDNYFVSY